MDTYKYVIIGGGMTADAAVKAIRSLDATGSIALFSKESDRPYDRPPLSKGLWKGASEADVFRKTPEANVDFILDTEIVSIDRQQKYVTSESGKQFGYDKLLLATGGRPRMLSYDAHGIIYYRTLADYHRLRELTDLKNDFLVIGGGFIGTEIAAALNIAGKSVTMILPEAGLGARNYPADLSNHITEYYESKGVAVRTNEKITKIRNNADRHMVETASGYTGSFDAVVAGIGIEVNTELALAAGLEVENGIVVDSNCRTTDPSIYAAGDVARFFNPHLGKRIRVEHEDNANAMGRAAGTNMAGGSEKYNHLPAFYSDLFDMGYEAIGELDARHEIVADWKEKYSEGVVYYLSERRVRGVLLWNVWGQLDEARGLIAGPGPIDPNSLIGRIHG